MIVTSSQAKAPSSLGSSSEHRAVYSAAGNANDTNTNQPFTPRLPSSLFSQGPHRRVTSMYADRSWGMDSVHSSPIMRGVPPGSGSSPSSTLSARIDGTLPSRATGSWTRTKVNDQNGRINALLEEMRPSSSNSISRNQLMSPSNGATYRPYAVEPNRIRSALSQDDFSYRFRNPVLDSGSSFTSNSYSTCVPRSNDYYRPVLEASSRISPSALDSKRLERFESPPVPAKDFRNGQAKGGTEGRPTTVRLASPDSWMRNRDTRPISPSVPHTFSPRWRRSALAYPEYNLPPEVTKEETESGVCSSHETLYTSNNGERTPAKTANANANAIRMRNDAPFYKDATKRYAGSNWEKQFDDEANAAVTKCAANNAVDRSNDSMSISNSSSFERFTARHASFMAAISGNERRGAQDDEKRSSKEAANQSLSSILTAAMHPSLIRASAVGNPLRTPPSYVLSGTIGGTSPPNEKRAFQAKPPQSRHTHRLLCTSRNNEKVSPLPYECSSNVRLNAYEEREKTEMGPFCCLEQIATANNYLRMSKRNKSASLRLSAPTLPPPSPVDEFSLTEQQQAEPPPKPPRDLRRRTMHGWCYF
ncbi:unnamed protein product [Toxocara canis]|uniref:Non-specific serine/threonine protein kinase n=1 Tax=Toxocara canis TaxID=6265 RepID=A0A183UXP6_TOXCA|nr:unnamed protein product [Toxocara canis]